MGKRWESHHYTKDSYESYETYAKNQMMFGSIPTSIWITLMYILSLYLWPNHRQRYNSATVVRRLISITISTCISIFIVYLYSRYHSNKSWTQLIMSFRIRKLKIKDIVWPLIITATIFLGPIIDDLISKRLPIPTSLRLPSFRPLSFSRSFVVPVIEEIVFRCLLFGAAHLHPQLMQHVFVDIERQFIADSIIQFFFTSAFGMYAATIFMKTQSLWPAALVHIFCNLMGLPTASIIRNNMLKAVTIIGLSTWIVLYTQYLLDNQVT